MSKVEISSYLHKSHIVLNELMCLERDLKIVDYVGDGVGSALVGSGLADCHCSSRLV